MSLVSEPGLPVPPSFDLEKRAKHRIFAIHPRSPTVAPVRRPINLDPSCLNCMICLSGKPGKCGRL
ncbi:hypothetical protein RISK_003722 [Rhodopirellula islandica]|uniref:Uncharacterized protein n=1 Tax=Rhodopirellula islandica TaxID=595434 RepID=A0A0J1BCA1_RHOIS|nr:hypothetical protein RISK_003722 [Rhodopirellula islandica]